MNASPRPSSHFHRRLRGPALEDLACAALFAFFAMQGSIPGIAPAQALEMTASAPSPHNTLGGIGSQAVANALILLLVLRRPRLVFSRLTAVPWLALLAMLAIVSSLWSLDPLLTLRRSLPFALAGLFGVYFAARFPQPRQLAILRLTMVTLASATIAIVFLAPAIGLDHSAGHAGDWQGVFTHKNACGRMMVLATAVVLFGGRMTLRRLASLALFVLVLLMSGSRGAWMIEAGLLLLWLVVWIARRTSAHGRLLLALAAPAVTGGLATLAMAYASRVAAFLGRDLTLSGRTAIWEQVVHSIAARPLLGYGYDAFWRGMQGPSLEISAALHFIVLHAHNGFLEIVLELGAVGLLLFCLTAFRTARQLWPLWRSGEVHRIAFPLAVLFLVVLWDLDENTLLLYNGLFWILCVASLVTVDSVFRDHRHKRAAAPHAILTVARRQPRRLVGPAAPEIS